MSLGGESCSLLLASADRRVLANHVERVTKLIKRTGGKFKGPAPLPVADPGDVVNFLRFVSGGGSHFKPDGGSGWILRLADDENQVKDIINRAEEGDAIMGRELNISGDRAIKEVLSEDTPSEVYIDAIIGGDRSSADARPSYDYDIDLENLVGSSSTSESPGNPESPKQLYEILRDTDFGCVPPGFHETPEVYEIVREKYPGLCNDRVLCRDTCGTNNDQPEWKHRVRTLQQDLAGNSESRVQNLSNGWYYGPTEVGVTEVPNDPPKFEVGSHYNRWQLHDVYGGQRYSGIATPADYQQVFIFTGESGETYGYEDEFLDDDSFLYTGEGAEGDMTMDGGNAAIRNHHSNNETLHLFEDAEYPWIVTYVGQFEYAGHQWDTLEDREGDQREAIRFRLEPVGGTEVIIEDGTPGSLSGEELFKKAKESSPKPSGGGGGSRGSRSGRSYRRSEVVKKFALQAANGVCQGCDEDAPFIDERGEPFLEVHHLHRRSDGGPDDPENVIAICPNCHREVHYGQGGEELNRALIEAAEDRNTTLNE